MSSSIETAESSPAENLLANYSPRPGSYDELFDDRSQIRGTWRQFTAGLEAMGSAGLGQRYEQARRLLRENGIVQGSAGLPHSTDRNWELDPLPLLLAKSEWDWLASAVSQRVQLLNLILADLYGPQNLVREGLIPPELVFGQHSFLLPCQGVPVPRNIFLHLYACHLAAAPTAAGAFIPTIPKGHRERAWPWKIASSLPASCPPTSIACTWSGWPDFSSPSATRCNRSPSSGTTTRASCSSRPAREVPSYFEDAYLARYLGYTLVEGGDLTIRSTNVYLKTLGGLLPVDVILRRMLDEEADPLELRYDSMYGVAGLVQAVRGGQVVVANALGSGLLESPALMAFLPAICRKLLGEELKLHSVPTWWCGATKTGRTSNRTSMTL